jgi:DNA-binding PadR family transcriptional regulator
LYNALIIIPMATIDLIVLGIIKKEPLSAYDIQKLVEYRYISRWVKISTPSIYKKVIQLEAKGLIRGTVVKAGNMAEKSVYSLTESGEREFEELMLGIASEPIAIFLDFNAVIINLDALPPAKQETCLASIEENVRTLKTYLKENLDKRKKVPQISETGIAVFQQQLILAQAIEKWLLSLKESPRK